ncbi:MAG TPA: DinB family protein [Thermomonospora sp.]|nr:DinB family protein [Thermomonospora sp.]
MFEIPPPAADEQTLLLAFLNLNRAAVTAKCEGLDEDLAHRAVLPTSPLMTVAGLVSHLRWVEQSWFCHVLMGEPELGPWTDEDPDRDFRVDDVPLATLLADYRRQCDRSDEIVGDLGLTALAATERRGERRSVRWVVIHMIEETARHAGHLDILRETLDGRTGYP